MKITSTQKEVLTIKENFLALTKLLDLNGVVLFNSLSTLFVNNIFDLVIKYGVPNLRTNSIQGFTPESDVVIKIQSLEKWGLKNKVPTALHIELADKEETPLIYKESELKKTDSNENEVKVFFIKGNNGLSTKVVWNKSISEIAIHHFIQMMDEQAKKAGIKKNGKGRYILTQPIPVQAPA